MRQILSLIEECERLEVIREDFLYGTPITRRERLVALDKLDARLSARMNLLRTNEEFSDFRGLTYNVLMLYLFTKKKAIVAGELTGNFQLIEGLDGDFDDIYFNDHKMLIVARFTFENYFMGGVGMSA